MVDHAQTSKISLNNAGEALALFGPQDKFIHLIERETHAHIFTRDAELTISGDTKNVRIAEHLFEVLLELVRNQYMLTERDVHYAVELARQMKADQLLDLFKGRLPIPQKESPSGSKRLARSSMWNRLRIKILYSALVRQGQGKPTWLLCWPSPPLKRAGSRELCSPGRLSRQGRVWVFCPGISRKKLTPIYGHCMMLLMMYWDLNKWPNLLNVG